MQFCISTGGFLIKLLNNNTNRTEKCLETKESRNIFATHMSGSSVANYKEHCG